MRFLILHAGSMKYRPTKEVKIRTRDELDEDELNWVEFSNVLVVFTCVEKVDEENETTIVNKAVEELVTIADRVKCKNVLIYPYAHLFAEKLASPQAAIKIFDLLVENLKSRGLDATRAPFGWYKEFSVHCLGHPLAESSRIIRP
ncbi:MAG: threonyl-tRNA synthetase editing domain-containing protein [Candidatus Odinarchaeia archaeon]